MQAALSRALMTMVALTLSLQTAAAADPLTIDFEDATGIAQLLGVQAGSNNGFEGFYWAWHGAGVVDPGGPANQGFLLGARGVDFDWVGGSGQQFVYFGPGSEQTTAFVLTGSSAFDFFGGWFSSQGVGTLTIQGQVKSGPGQGQGGYTDIDAPIAIVFDGTAATEQQLIGPSTPGTALIGGADRLVISLTAGRNVQWAMDDFAYAPIPEPGTWAMFGLGLLGMGFAVSRQKRLVRPR